jgi:uncharacterized cupredoxin-like copper-binding protein
VRIPSRVGSVGRTKEHDVTGKLFATVGAVAVVALGTGAVAGAQQDRATASRGQTLRTSADPSGKLRFIPNRLSARRGAVTIVMTNPRSSGMMHGIALEGRGVDKGGRIVQPGKTSSVTARLKKGRYVFYCPVPGHRQAGMVGRLTVK